jgi:hypothetical protein
MNCDFCEKYETGQIEESLFQDHLKKCSFCQHQISEDKKLLELSQSIKQPVEVPNLWDKIELSLENEKNKVEKSWREYLPIFRIAAMLILVFGLTIIFLNRNNVQDSKLLANSSLEKVEQKEQELENAISGLEKIALPKLSNMDLELMFLYRDRLETIETQIVQCKEMLNENPANAHLRRYLLSAYQDKKETLDELMNDQL